MVCVSDQIYDQIIHLFTLFLQVPSPPQMTPLSITAVGHWYHAIAGFFFIFMSLYGLLKELVNRNYLFSLTIHFKFDIISYSLFIDYTYH